MEKKEGRLDDDGGRYEGTELKDSGTGNGALSGGRAILSSGWHSNGLASWWEKMGAEEGWWEGAGSEIDFMPESDTALRKE